MTEPSAVGDGSHPSPIAALRFSPYRWFSLAQVAGNCAMWMHRASHVWLVTQLSGGDGLAVGAVTSLQFAPMVILGLGGSTLGDRFDKRKLMLITQLVVVLTCVVVVVMLVRGAMTLPAALVLAVILGIPGAIDAPVRLSYPRQLVPRPMLPAAVGVNGTIFQLARVLGPAMAGAVISSFSTAAAFGAAAALGLLACVALARLPGLARADRIDMRSIPSWRRTLAELIPSNTALPLLCGFVLGVGMTNLQLAVPLVLSDDDAGSFGLLLAMLGTGGVVGAAVTSTVLREPRNDRLYLWSILFALTCAGFALMPSVAAMAVTAFVAGAIMQTFGTTAISALQLRGRAESQSRLMTLYVIVFFIWAPVGAPVFGAVCNAIGVRPALIASSLVCLLLIACSGLLLRGGPATDRSAVIA